MRKLLLPVICFLCLVPVARAQNVTPEMQATFTDKMKSALEKKDFDAFSALICQDGALTPEMQAMVQKSYRDMFDSFSANTAPRFELVPPPADEMTSFTREGKTYTTNLTVVKLIKISFPNSPPNALAHGAVGFPLGIKDGALMITQVTEKP